MSAGLLLLLLAATPAGDVPAQPVPGASCRERYHQPASFLANPDESVLIAGIIGWCRQHRTRLLWDERYARVARLWSEQLARAGHLPEQSLPAERLRFELQRQGVSDAQVTPFSLLGPVEKVPPGLLDFLDERAAAGRYTHFAVGVGRLPGQKRMMVTLLLGRRPAIIDPLPVCPPPGSHLAVSLRLLRGFSHPTWLMTTPDDKIVRDVFGQQEGRFHGEIPLEHGSGTYRLEILVQGDSGPEVAALFPLYAGVPRPRAPVVKLRPAPKRYRSPEQAEQALLEMINRERERFDLPPLRADEKLAAVARRQALQVLAHGHAAHRSASTGSLPQRLRASGITFVRALENVALAASPQAAHDRIMSSPGHRLNVLDPGVTHLGVGVALERGASEDTVAVCQVFVERPPDSSQQELAGRILDMVNARRRRKGRFALGWDRQLAAAALRTARCLAGLGEEADLQQQSRQLVRQLTEADENLRAVTARIFFTARPQRVLRVPEIYAEDINRLGAGVVPGPGRPPAQYWIVVVFAGR
ncbi:MAG: hypothetical protein DRI34_06775 [Deltaproteobacteria bacterium]|nr:MAG: hypothetical protein DRI34_06775 [Deltaproteobacteria bacterium]